MPIRRFVLAVFLCAAAALHAASLDNVGRPVDDSIVPGSETRFKVELAGAKDNVKMARLKDGSVVYVIKRLGTGSDRILTSEEFTKLYYDQQSTRGWFFALLNITSQNGVAWVILGLAGQLVFTGRFLVQWFASEKSKKSVMPVSFWWMSLIGGTMCLVYFIWRRDIVGVLGQSAGWVVYIRNLTLIYRAKN